MTKRFGPRVVVDRLNLRVPEGSVFGFLGPNGSGKTTTIRMLMGLAFPTSGTARVLGAEVPRDADRVLPEVGMLVEGPAFYPWLSGRDNLVRMDAVGPERGGGRDRARRVDEALARVGLTGAADRLYRRYSLGMRQRLGLAAALTRPRRLLVLDEPTNGLDPQGMREVRLLLRSLAAEGTTVFLSTHLLAEVEQTCTHACVLSRGRTVAQGSLAELRSGARPSLQIGTPDAARAAEVLHSIPGVGAVRVEGETVSAELWELAAEDANAALVHAGVRVRSLAGAESSLEDAFVALTGAGFEVDAGEMVTARAADDDDPR